MGAGKNSISNLSKDKYTIKAKSTQTLSFMGASPNYYRITNGGASPLYLGVSMMPTLDFFDMKIPSATTKLYVDAYGHDEIYIYNPSSTDANIIVTSFSASFDSTVLALSDVGQDFSNIEFSGEMEAKGEMKNILENINKYISKLSDCASSLAEVNETVQDYVPTIYNIHNILDNQRNVIIRQEKQTTEAITLKMFHIELLSNDSDSDLNLTINNRPFTLKPNEILNKIQIKSQTNVVIPVNSTFRVIGG